MSIEAQLAQSPCPRCHGGGSHHGVSCGCSAGRQTAAVDHMELDRGRVVIVEVKGATPPLYVSGTSRRPRSSPRRSRAAPSVVVAS